MPNQLNFPDPISSFDNIRPSRLASIETNLFQVGIKQVIFGTNVNDRVEVWIYNSDGTIDGHITLNATDTALALNTVVDNTGAYEFLNLDMGDLIRKMGIEQGRYAFVANFFRDEVGSENGYKLYIETISDDRTELRLFPVQVDNPTLRDIYEWVVPSVPKLEAQALIDQTFGKSLNFSVNETLNSSNITDALVALIQDTLDRILHANAIEQYNNTLILILERTYTNLLENMAKDVNNLNVQEADLEFYLTKALSDTIRQLRDQNLIDARFNIF